MLTGPLIFCNWGRCWSPSSKLSHRCNHWLDFIQR